MKNGSSDVFVTNKHIVDASITFGIKTKYKLKELEIELREFHGKFPSSATNFFQIKGIPDCISISSTADAAIIRDPIFENLTGDFRHGRVLKTDDLADQKFLENKVQIMDIASFIGFPGNKMSQWWDKDWNLGIARLVNIASMPGIPFTHEDVQTSGVTLVSGLSFSGSSGSVVILHEKSIRPGQGLSNPGYVPPKILAARLESHILCRGHPVRAFRGHLALDIALFSRPGGPRYARARRPRHFLNGLLGIMSGHWPEPETTPEMFSHSGLSYYTRSTTIIQLLKQPVT